MLNLYKIKINMPVNAGTYYVVADGFDEAAGIAMTTDQGNGGHNGGIDHIEVVGSFGGDGENLLLSDKAANFFTAT